eukprot:m.332963 g.332963  ORF g.332963 m.332963 type:complete len:738 (+) comp27734_c0_seq2:32-2245(+)
MEKAAAMADKAEKKARKEAAKLADKQRKKDEKELKAAMKKAKKERTKSRKGSVGAAGNDDDDENGVEWRDEGRAPMGVYHTGHAYEEVDFTMTMERAQNILQNEPNSELAPEARKFLLAEAAKLQAQATLATQLAGLAAAPPLTSPQSMDGIAALVGVLGEEDASDGGGGEGTPLYVDMAGANVPAQAAAVSTGYALMTPADAGVAHTGYDTLAAGQSRSAGVPHSDQTYDTTRIIPGAPKPDTTYDSTGIIPGNQPPTSTISEGTYDSTRIIPKHVQPPPGARGSEKRAAQYVSPTQVQPHPGATVVPYTSSAQAYDNVDHSTAPTIVGPPRPPESEMAQFPGMTLDGAQEVMVRGAPDGPEKRVAQYVLLSEAARLEALMASLSADSADDDDDNGDENDGRPSPSAAAVAVAAPPPTAVPETSVTGGPTPAEIARYPNMNIESAQVVMAKCLPDSNLEKRVAQYILLREASRLEEMMAKLDESDSEEEAAPADATPTPAESSSFTAATANPHTAAVDQALKDNAIYKATQLAKSGGVDRSDTHTEAEERRRTAQAEARKLVGAQFDVDALKSKERQDNEARMARLQQGGAVKVPDVVKVSRKYGTEDERNQAEASVEDTQKRLADVPFDFSFSSGADTAPAPAKTTPVATVAAATSDEGSFSFGWDGGAAKAVPAAEDAAAPDRRPSAAAAVDWKAKKANARKYATEDERHAAEASVEETESRLKEMTFDFSFGS